MKTIILLSLFSLSSFASCLPIENFAQLDAHSNYDSDSHHWSGTYLITMDSPSVALHNRRIETIYGYGLAEFLEYTGFNYDGLYMETITMNSGKMYDMYVYEAGDNGSGFIFEAGRSDKLAATISDGIGGEISGCLTY